MTVPIRAIIATMVGALGLLSLAGCPGPGAEATDPPCTPALGQSHLNIGIHSDEPGWGLEEDYRRSGFDYDFANWLATELCFEPTFVNVASAQRLEYLERGNVHMVLATFSKTDERAARISFAAPYVLNRQGVLVRADDGRIERINDLDGKSVCTAAGTTSLDQLERAESVQITIVQQHGIRECLDELRTRRVDAVSTDQLILYGFASQDPDVAVVPELVFGHEEQYGIGIPLGATQWCTVLTDAIREFIVSGRWDTAFRTNMSNAPRPDQYRPDPNLLDRCA